MMMELDHFFIFTTVNAPEADRVIDLGLIEGKSNTHPGQGTANRRVFFQNTMLEFLWVVDESEVRSPIIAPTHLWERWRYSETGYSPFAIGLGRSAENEKLPFATWDYRPPYLPPHFKIDVASNTNPYEPFLFVIPFPKSDRSINHPSGIKEITNIKITIPSNKPLSQAINTIQEAGLVTLSQGKEHLVEIECDLAFGEALRERGIQQQTVDFRPSLPVIFRW
jgi:hypothetical protein